jgi:hypothetical protein
VLPAGVVLVLLVLLAVVSWSFSSVVLVADHSPRDADATVKGVRSDQVVLSRSSDSLRPGVYGLDWHGGHAIVEGVVSSDAHTVTRGLRAVTGHLAVGTRVAFDPAVYEGNPQQALGMRFSNVAVPDELGRMPAWLIAGRTHTWAIVVHGINGDRENNLRIVPTLHRAGLPTLLITYREDVGAPLRACARREAPRGGGLFDGRRDSDAVHGALAAGARRGGHGAGRARPLVEADPLLQR